MKAEGIRAVLSSPYFVTRYAEFVSKNTGAKIVLLAHQVGSRPGTDDYLSMIDYNVRRWWLRLGGSSLIRFSRRRRCHSLLLCDLDVL